MALKLPYDQDVADMVMAPDADTEDSPVPREPISKYVYQIRTGSETYTLIANDLKEALDLFLEKSRYIPISIVQQQRIDFNGR